MLRGDPGQYVSHPVRYIGIQAIWRHVQPAQYDCRVSPGEYVLDLNVQGFHSCNQELAQDLSTAQLEPGCCTYRGEGSNLGFRLH